MENNNDFSMEGFSFLTVYSYISSEENMTHFNLLGHCEGLLGTNGLGISYDWTKLDSEVYKKKLSFFLNRKLNEPKKYALSQADVLSAISDALRLSDNADERVFNYLCKVKQIVSVSAVKLRADNVIKAFMSVNPSYIFEKSEMANLFFVFIKRIYEGNISVVINEIEFDYVTICMAWILFASFFPVDIELYRGWATSRNESYKDYSECIECYLKISKYFKEYYKPDKPKQAPPKQDPPKQDPSSSKKPVTENMMNPLGDETTLAIITMAHEICMTAKQDGRLIPIADVDGNEFIELPDLDYENTVSSGDTEIKLIDLINAMSGRGSNILVTGLGGCGKTFALLHCCSQILESYISLIANKHNVIQPILNPFGVIPVYIKLNSLLSSANGIEDYIIGWLAHQMNKSYDDAKQSFNIWKDSAASSPTMRILLMCDGYNEVVSNEQQAKLRDEIKSLQNDKAYKIIVTSRYNLSRTFSNGSLTVSNFTAYKMNDLTDEVVISHVHDFLLANGKTERQIEAIIKKELKDKNNQVRDIFKKPMALVMFCGIHTGRLFETCHDDFFPKINKLGELLHNFIFCIKNVYDVNETLWYERFLRYLGYRMNVDGVFTVSFGDFDGYIDDFNRYIDDFIGEYHSANISRDSVINSRFINDIMKFVRIRGTICEVSFNHQNYRDYMAAAFLKEIIVNNNIEEINSHISLDKKIPQEVLVLLADILSEYQYTGSMAEQSIIQQLLNNYGNELTASAIALLIKVVVIGRDYDLSAFKFEGLDLTQTKLNSVVLSKKSPRRMATFNGCKLSKDTLAPLGHAGAAQAILYVEDRYILTFAKNGFFVFDMLTGSSKMFADYNSTPVHSAALVPDAKRFVTGDANGRLVLWEYEITDDNFYISFVSLYDFRKSFLLDEKEELNIQDIVQFYGKFAVALKYGGIYTVDYKLKASKLLMGLPIIDGYGKKPKCCRLEVFGNELFASFGKYVFRKNKGSDKVFCYKIADSDGDGGYIHDIGKVSVGGCSALLVNYRDKLIGSSKVSIVYKLDITDYNEEMQIISEELRREVQGTTTQGFNGWNRFSEAFDYGKSVYLTADVNDMEDYAGFYLFSFELGYDDDDEEYILCKNCGDECFGSKHIMSVEAIKQIEYNRRKYAVTTSIDRAVEIIDVSGTENTLIYHVDGHTDGITCMDLIDENRIYTSHYSGEVCCWNKTKNDKWKCRLIVKPHANNWVWVVKNCVQNGKSYIVASSYDHNISITDPETGKYSILSGCEGRVKAFDFIGEDAIAAAYDHKDKEGKPKYIVKIFKGIDFAAGTFKGVVDLKCPAFIRAMRTFEDKLYLVMNDGSIGKVYSFDTEELLSANSLIEVNCEPIHTVCKNDKELLKTANMRALDVIRLDDGRLLFACGGDIDNIYAEVWLENGTKAVISNRPFYDQMATNRVFDSDDGIATLKLFKYNGDLYLATGGNDSLVHLYEIIVSSENKILLSPLAWIPAGDKVLNVQYLESNKMLYISLLSGKLMSDDVQYMLENVNEQRTKVLFKATTGMHIVNVNFSSCDTTDMPDDFKQSLSYYCRF